MSSSERLLHLAACGSSLPSVMCEEDTHTHTGIPVRGATKKAFPLRKRCAYIIHGACTVDMGRLKQHVQHGMAFNLLDGVQPLFAHV